MFGSATEDNIVKNLGSGSLLQAVRVLLCIDLFFTVPLQLSVAGEVLQGSLLAASPWVRRHPAIGLAMLRLTMLIALLFGAYGTIAADARNAFGNVITLVGGIGGFGLGFLAPPAMHLARRQLASGTRDKRASCSAAATALDVVVHVSIIVIGIAGMVATTYQAVVTMG